LRPGDPGAIGALPLVSGAMLGNAFASDAFVRAWIDLVIGRREDSQLDLGCTSKTAEIDLTNFTPIHRAEVDQSNTSVLLQCSGSDGPATEDL